MVVSKHNCKYWQNNLRHHYRRCGFCGRIQYNYTGEWKDELKSLNWLDEFMSLGSTSYEPQITIDVGYPFEMYTIENWNVAFRIKIGEKWFGPFPNFNCAQNTLRKDSQPSGSREPSSSGKTTE